LCGFPDGNPDPVATQIIKSSVNIVCPVGITSGTWDVMIVSTPWIKPIKFTTMSYLSGTDSNPNNELVILGAGANVTIGGLQTIAVPTGTSFNPGVAAPSTSIVYVPNTVNDQYCLGTQRVIAKGFEVHNTTAELNLQGMCTTFVVPISDIQTAGTVNEFIDTAGVVTLANAVSILQVEMWPNFQSNAVLTPGSRQWTAKQGCYMASNLKTNNVPLNETGYAIQPFISSLDSSTPTNLGPTPSPSPTSAAYAVHSNCFWDDFNMHGCIFSGLSLSSTLTVNYTYIIERHPDWNISDLVVLARPPPPRDNVALELYTHITDRMPIGVPVDENGLGDWFMDALSTAADFVSPVLSAIPGVGPALSGGVNALNTLYKTHKTAYETNPYAAVTPREIRAVANSAGSVVRQLRGNRSRKSPIIEEIVEQPPRAMPGRGSAPFVEEIVEEFPRKRRARRPRKPRNQRTAPIAPVHWSQSRKGQLRLQ
jgi:hypothetical protein